MHGLYNFGLAAVLALTIVFGGCSTTQSSTHAQDDGDEVAASTLTRVGQQAPDFTLTSVDGVTLSLAELKGQVVLVNFFATWCGPCKAEMPYLEAEVWRRFKDQGLVMVAIGREENVEDTAGFRDERKLTFPFAADPDRKVYRKYASAYIPRNYVIGRDGTILYQSQGFERLEFDAMIEVIAGALAP